MGRGGYEEDDERTVEMMGSLLDESENGGIERDVSSMKTHKSLSRPLSMRVSGGIEETEEEEDDLTSTLTDVTAFSTYNNTLPYQTSKHSQSNAFRLLRRCHSHRYK